MRLAICATLALALAACGSQTENPVAGPTTSTTTNSAVMSSQAEHDHGTIEWSGDDVPRIVVEVTADPKSGWNVYADVSGYRFAPEHASEGHVVGEGHAHIDLDGERLARVYGTAWHIPRLEPGSHELSFTLAANTHEVYTVDGEPLETHVTFDVPPASDDMGHDHSAEPREWDGPGAPSLEISVSRDAKSGWNLIAEIGGFDLAPRAASTEHVAGQGHMHWYVNGVKQGRLYNRALHIPELPAGDVEISVGLSGNDHVDYLLDGDPLKASVELAVTEDEGTGISESDGESVGDLVEIVVESGEVLGGPQKIEVELGSMVRFVVITDASDHVHVHGYDLLFDVAPGSETEVMFTADIPGIFEVELEDSHLLLVELEVS